MTAAPETKNKDIRKAECSKCGGLRNCNILGKHAQSGEEHDYFSWHKAWYILECRGCEHVFVQTVSTNSEDYYNYYGPDGETETEHNETIHYWPSLSKRAKPEWMSDAGIDADGVDALNDSLSELYGALNNDLYMLAAIGIRTSFDVASELLGIRPEQPFNAKLLQLVTDGHIGKVDQARLETLVDAGSASVHRGWQPKADDLNTLMNVLEQFVHDAFVAPARKTRLDAKVVLMKEKVPPRKLKRPKGKSRTKVGIAT
ncbi:DUF4145 domain-containing protein [Mesorhizobium opportunistum]|uniref:DUF4145 domain-containing protein n=1 Tax=Mesorhizobium opportunistum TaxID=593909 RepID=UPI00333C1639